MISQCFQTLRSTSLGNRHACELISNTMAVLWQLGVEFIQGYYVQGPEDIVLESAQATATDLEPTV